MSSFALLWHLGCAFISDRIRLRKWKSLMRPALLLPSIDLRQRGKDDVYRSAHRENALSCGPQSIVLCMKWTESFTWIFHLECFTGFFFRFCNAARETMLGILHTKRQGVCTYLWQIIFWLWNKVLSLMFRSSLVLSVDGTSTSHLISSNLQPWYKVSNFPVTWCWDHFWKCNYCLHNSANSWIIS